jgi:hypothetical protein
MRRASLIVLAATFAAGSLGIACGSSNNSTSPSDHDSGAEVDSSTTPDTGAAPDTGTAPQDAGAPGDAAAEAGFPAFTAKDVPQVVDAGGPVMTTPKVVPIFYANDDATTVASLKDYLSKLPGSTWWKGWSAEYGVGAVTIADPITLTDVLPATWDDSQIQADLANRLASLDGGAGAGFPAPDANTLYAYFFPPNVTITTGGGPVPEGGVPADAGSFGGGVQSSCTSFGGYHDDIALSATEFVAYAVVPRCANFGPNITGLDAITGPASHEIAEGVTDPFPSDNPAYVTVDTQHGYWSRLLGGGEVGDMCAQQDNSFVKYADLPYTVQRIWSNKAAMAGADPCVPTVPGHVFFNAYPVEPDMIVSSSRGATVTVQGIDIPPGGSKVMEFDLASTGVTSGPITIAIMDQGFITNGKNSYLSAAFEECNGAATCSGVNGQKFHAKITVTAAGRRNTEPFLIQTSLVSGEYQLWASEVGVGPDGG